MNLVKLIMDQCSEETLSKFSSVLGTDPEKVSASVSAAVPALLAGLGGMASRGEGAKKLAGVLGSIDPANVADYASQLGGDSSQLFNRGSGLLGSLFGDGMITGLSNAISRFTGINLATARSMLAYMLPMILGKVAQQWRSAGGTASALSSLFADQKRNIADAVPAGFSLADIPGWPDAGDVSRAAARAPRRAAEMAEAGTGSVANWLLPLAVLLVGGYLVWNFLLKPRPENPIAAQPNAQTEPQSTTVMKPVTPVTPETPAIPDAARMTDELKSILTSASSELSAITDAATAEAAMPKLQDLKMKLDGLEAAWAKLPEVSQPMLRQLVDEQLQPLKQKADEVTTIPGISDRVIALIKEILERFTELAAPATASANQ